MKSLPPLIVSLFLLTLPSAAAFTFTRDVDLYFGELAIPSNDTVSSMTITRQGRVSSTGKIFVLTPGSAGEYTIEGLTPYTSVDLSIPLPVESSATMSGTEQLTVTAVDMPSSVAVNSDGVAQFKIGATIVTSGTGGQYVSGASYPFYLTLEISL